ncbi:MAG: hypothetical protein JXR36_04125 [Bacteroidales bacterium]|nr:hypothetical protein [Bacteroidales bacterium]
MSWTDNLKNAPNLEKKRFNHKVVKVVKNDSGVPEFVHYDKDAGNIVVPKISGAIVGDTLLLESFDSRLNKMWRSAYILNRDKVSIFKPTGGFATDKPIPYKEAKILIEQMSGSRPRLFNVIFVYDYNEKETYGIYTNATISFDQMAKHSDSVRKKGCEVTFVPEIYSKKSDVSDKAMEMLGKVALKNAPSFANMVIGDPISEDIAEQSGLIDVINEYNEWSNDAFTSKDVQQNEQFYNEADNTPIDNSNNNDNSNDDDDLPF